jgi:hypothetical protein
MRGISRHDEVLNYLTDYFELHQRMPSRKQIEYALKIGNGSLGRIFTKLVKNGYLKRVPPTFPIWYNLK